jgi:ATP-dependent Clp protease ATP-binding subunit ClpC
MPKINVYLPDDLAAAVRDAQVPVSAVCQRALERAVRDVGSLRAADEAPPADKPARGMFGRFTPRARTVVSLAESTAREMEHETVGTEHVLLGILDEGGNLAIKVLEALDIELADLRAELVGSMGPKRQAMEGHIPFSPTAKEALTIALNEAISMLHNYIGCEHLLLGVLGAEKGLASEVLRRMGVEMVTTRRAVNTALTGFVHARSEQAARPAPAPAPKAEPENGDALQQILQRLDAIEKRLPS